MKRAIPYRPGGSALLLACLLAATALLTVAPVTAQFVLPDEEDPSPARAGKVSGADNVKRPARGEPVGEVVVVHEPSEAEGAAAGEGWLPDEGPSDWDGAAEEDAFREPEPIEPPLGQTEGVVVEWVEEGGDVSPRAYPSRVYRTHAGPVRGEEDANPSEARSEGVEQQRESIEAIDSREAAETEPDALFVELPPAERATFGLSLEGYRFPDQLMEPHWSQCVEVLEEGSIASLQSALNRLYEAKLDTGFRNMPAYATLLVRRAGHSLQSGKFLEARLLGEAAYNLAPEYYPVSSTLSRLVRKDPQRGFLNSLKWRWISLKQMFQDFMWQFTTAGRAYALVLITLYLSFLAFGFYLLGRYAGVLLHFIRERTPFGPAGMAVVGTLLFATLLVLLFLPGPFWVTVFLGFLAGRFSQRWEKAFFSAFLVLWALSPWLFNHTVCFFSPLSEATYSIQRCIRGEWDAEGEESLTAASEMYPDSPDLQLTRALVDKRRGEYDRAKKVLKKALMAHPDRGRLWNNLGNLHAIHGELEEAKSAYRKAILYGNGSAAPHYNLSQLLRREFSFLKGAQEYQAARKIDAEQVDYFTYIHSPNPNRYFIDEEPRGIAMWRYAFYRSPETERAADDVWRSTAAGIPLRQTTWVFLAMTAVYVMLVARRRSGQEPFTCSGCGKIVCAKCDVGAQVGGLCSPCYQALYQRENISKERRHGQIRKMARHQSRRSRRLLILNLLLPGLGFSLLEEKPRGLWLLLGFFFLVLVAVFWSSMLPVPMTVWETAGSVSRVLCVVFLVGLYLFTQQRFLDKIRARR